MIESQNGPSTPHGAAFPAVSVIMPVLNEEEHLARSLDHVLRQEYPGAVEVVVAVGPSRDDSRRIADQLATRDPRIVVVDNPTGTTPNALNLAVAASHYDIILRVDAHGELAANYIGIAVELLQRTGAANVGGVMAAQGQTPFEEAVAAAYNSRLGLGGGSFHLKNSPEGPADTVFLGVFRREVLLEVGGFDAELHRAQDWELNYRLRKAGHTVWFSPRLHVTYRPRSTVRGLTGQFFRTGQWRREVIRRNPETASARYLAPPIVVLGATGGAVIGAAGVLASSRVLTAAWLAPAGYLASILVGSALLRKRLPWQVRARLPLVLAVMHLSWGTGFLVGVREGTSPPSAT